MRALILLAMLAIRVPAMDETAALAAIAQQETGNRDLVGRAGEVGPHQLAPVTVRQHGSREPQLHLAWLRRQFAARGVHWCIFNVALAWNAGLEAATGGRAPVRSYAYARAVERIYQGGRAP